MQDGGNWRTHRDRCKRGKTLSRFKLTPHTHVESIGGAVQGDQYSAISHRTTIQRKARPGMPVASHPTCLAPPKKGSAVHNTHIVHTSAQSTLLLNMLLIGFQSRPTAAEPPRRRPWARGSLAGSGGSDGPRRHSSPPGQRRPQRHQ